MTVETENPQEVAQPEGQVVDAEFEEIGLVQMTADTVGRDLLEAVVSEIKLLHDPWPKLSQSKQNDVIDRLRARVERVTRNAVHLLAAQGRTVVAGALEQITIKDGVKAVVKFGVGAPSLSELYEQQGKAVLVVVANHIDNLGGMDSVKGESDQRGLNLGHEYDPNGDGKGMDDTQPTWPFQKPIASREPTITYEWNHKKDSMKIGLLKIDSDKWAHSINWQIGTTGRACPFSKEDTGTFEEAKAAAIEAADEVFGSDVKLSKDASKSLSEWLDEVANKEEVSAA